MILVHFQAFFHLLLFMSRKDEDKYVETQNIVETQYFASQLAKIFLKFVEIVTDAV